MGGGQTSRGGARIGEKLLMGQVREAEQWSTPIAQDAKQTPTPPSGHDPNSRRWDLLAAQVEREAEVEPNWPTATARDAQASGVSTDTLARSPNAATLTDAANKFDWETPQTSNRKSRKALTASTKNGRRSGGGNSSTPGLEQQAELAAGIMPTEMDGTDLAPKAAAFVSRTWPPTPKAEDGRAKGNGGARNSPGLDQMARDGLLDQGSHSSGGKSRAWRTPHGMPSEDNPRRQGPSGSELGFQVMREELTNWPTATTSNGGIEQLKSGGRGVNLTTASLRDWPTPQTVDQGTGREPRLKTDRVNRPTGTPGSYRGDLKDVATPRGVLNARWVAQLMGFPPDWCDVSADTTERP
jgi:hypothetical protein